MSGTSNSGTSSSSISSGSKRSDGIIQNNNNNNNNENTSNITGSNSPSHRNTPAVPQWREAVAGAGAGAISRTIMAPIERIKLLQQLQYSTTTTGSTTTRSTRGRMNDIHQLSAWQIASKLHREEGWRSFWRGNVPNILRVAGTQALNFTGMEYYKRVAIAPWMERHWCTTAAPVITTTTSSSTSNSQLQQQQQQHHHERQRRNRSVLTSFISGGLAGATATTLLYPFEFVRTRLAMDRGQDTPHRHRTVATAVLSPTMSAPPQLQPHPITTTSSTTVTSRSASTRPQQHYRQYTGMMDVVRHILLKSPDGVGGLYQGYGVALVGGIVYRILYLGGYDAGKTELLYYRRHHAAATVPLQQQPQQKQPPTIELSWTERFCMAQTIALLAGTITYPFDSVRRRMMMQAGIPQVERLYTNSIHCTVQIWKTEGIRGFYLGLGPNLVRSVGGALILVGYDGIRTFL